MVSIDVMASTLFSWSFDISSPTVLVKCSVWAFLASDSEAVVALASSTKSMRTYWFVTSCSFTC